ncbi:cobaltochelatase subunit CobN [Microvirga pudoricolor]|uniref:cobaltochelatase subunit CobN n=1 Tax=Microvirga pudoricolor TaxID=2778729 RepID=UPI001E53CE24|nr:cobaltochelatase subunit CobN [Microvirga pudoricolor]MBM6592897.1 cobaltochelatase subunit CobN [Microvirga pudoricolor]
MHLLPVTTVSLDESDRAIDLGQVPGDVLVLSFTDSDLTALAAAYRLGRNSLPSLRLASLRQLRHPLSVDLYAEKTVPGAKFVLVRCLGGLDYWRYGLERLRAVCRERGIGLAVLPGDDRPDPRLAEFGTVPPHLLRELDAYFRAGGVDNLHAMLLRIASEIGDGRGADAPKAVSRAFVWHPGMGAISVQHACAPLEPERPVAYVIVYRSSVLSADMAAVEAFAASLRAEGVSPLVVAVASLKDEEASRLLRELLRVRRPDIIVTTTAFSARDDAGFVLDEADCPVLQALNPSSSREAWEASARGLSASDLTMQAVLPEFDGRLAIGPIGFKEEDEPDPVLGFTGRRQQPYPEGIAAATEAALAWIGLRRKPRPDRRLALVLSDYPARGGRAGFAVGLDTPASVCAILDTLAADGYRARRGFAQDDLMPALTGSGEAFAVPLAPYLAWLAGLPAPVRDGIAAAWGPPEADPAIADGAFRFTVVRAGHVLVALQPDRGRGADRKAFYHDPDAPPTHAYLAFYLGLRRIEGIDAIIHLGTHGTTEWLPGKAAALSPRCAPRLAVGSLPVIYPFIVDDPGEAAPAKRRLSGVTVGHMTPAVAQAELSEDNAVLRELVEEYSAAQTLDPRRADIVAREIMERARASGLAAQCGVRADAPMDEALTCLDAHLCDLAEVTIRDGLHVFGEGAGSLEHSARGEREGLRRALDGRFVIPGPAGSPSRGRLDVMPTGRNLTTLDPRAIPTRAATALGQRAAAEVIRRHLQDEGDYPRRIVMDLWASPTLRSGGEDLAHAMTLMGVRPKWDTGSTRVTGFEIVPQPLLDHPRIDVTLRISGVFRDTFPDQIVLLDRAARAVAALDEDDEWNALAAARRRGESLARVFGAAPGRYGAGVSGEALDGDWDSDADLGRAYLALTSHAFGTDENGRPDGSFERRVAGADAFVHVSDVAERDLLDGDSHGDAVGGFAAAARLLGAAPSLYSLDTSRAEAPKARTLREDIGRLVHGRLVHPRWIEAQLRHGWRGAAEFAQAVDALYVFAATTDAVSDAALDAVYGAYVADPNVYERIQAANPDAARSILNRLADARRRGLWTSRRNSVDAALDALRERAP